MNSNLEKFYFKKTEPNKSCLLALRDVILAQDKHISETVKYGMPCFCYKHKMFTYLWVDKNTDEPYILFVEGNYLNHPELEKGKRSRMKIFRVNPNIDLPIQRISNLLDLALNLYKKGIIEIKK